MLWCNFLLAETEVVMTTLTSWRASDKNCGRDPFNQNSNRSDREKRTTSKGGPVFSKLFRLDRTDPLSFGPKFPEILVEWIAPCIFTGYGIFVPKKSWYFIGIYMINRQVQKSERIESAFSIYLKSVAACTSKILFCCDFTTNVLCI